MLTKVLSFLKISAVFIAVLAVCGGCYQAHSDDDLRTVPVTNNPNIVPGSGMGNFSAVGY